MGRSATKVKKPTPTHRLETMHPSPPLAPYPHSLTLHGSLLNALPAVKSNHTTVLQSPSTPPSPFPCFHLPLATPLPPPPLSLPRPERAPFTMLFPLARCCVCSAGCVRVVACSTARMGGEAAAVGEEEGGAGRPDMSNCRGRAPKYTAQYSTAWQHGSLCQHTLNQNKWTWLVTQLQVR